MRDLTVHDPLGIEPDRHIATQGDTNISAWALSSDGRQLALGDLQGHLYLVDTATNVATRLPAQRTREITWLSFSEDDAWLAVASFDGLAQVFDVATRDFVVSGEIRAEFPLMQVGISHRQRLLIAAGQRQTALWRVSEPVVRVRSADRIGVAPAELRQTRAWYPLAWSLEQGLLAAAGQDRLVRLWRLPASPILEAAAPRQVPDKIHHDATKVIDAQWDKIRLVSPKGRAMTRWLDLPQPVGYAEIADDGRLLLVTVGPQLHAYDALTMAPRYAPVPLPQSPQRFLVAEDGSTVLMSFGSHGAHGHEEHLRLFDGVHGDWLPGEIVLDGPIMRYAFSADGRRLVAVGTRDGVTSVIETDELTLLADFPHDPYEPVVWAEARGNEIFLLTRPLDEQLGDASLIVWNPDNDQILQEYSLEGADPTSFLVHDDEYFVAGNAFDVRLSADGTASRLPRLAQTTTDLDYTLMSLSPDGRLLARGFRNEIQIQEAHTGAPLGRPLATDVGALAALTSLTFTPDGRALRADTVYNHQLSWAIAPETRPAAEREEALSQLLPSAERSPVYAPTDADRTGMRANDPGAWTPDTQLANRPAVVLAREAMPGVKVPEREPDTPASLLDLTRFYDGGTESVTNTFWSALTTIWRYPAGIQRIGDIDFDIRGMVELGRPRGTDDAADIRIECLAMPAVPVDKVHILGYLGRSVAGTLGETQARLTLHYGNGSEAVIPLRAGVDLPTMDPSIDDGRVPLVFATDHALAKLNTLLMTLTVSTLVNPHPDRIPRCLDLEMEPDSGSLTVLAVSVG